MSAKFEKGNRVGIVGGRKGKGMRGEVFWIGESRYGKGARYGVRGDDGETYWIDEEQLGAEDAVEAPELPEIVTLEKGTRVHVVRGEHAGVAGEIFWIGDSKFGRGPRYGIRIEGEEEALWVDGSVCEAEAAPSAPSAEPKAARAPKDDDEPPLPDDSDFYERDDDEPPF